MDESSRGSDARRQESITVPVVADSVPRGTRSPRLARCVYFVITLDDPNEIWILLTTSGQVPFILLGLQGIIFQPAPPSSLTFARPDDWNSVIKAVERYPGLNVEFDYFWLPVELLDSARRSISTIDGTSLTLAARGDVYRLSHRLFIEAWKAARDGVAFDRYATRIINAFITDQTATGITYSAEETKSLETWAIDQVATARIG